MLELPNFGHMTRSTIYFVSRDKILLVTMVKIKEIIDPRKNQWNSNFPNMELTTYSILTQDQARKHDSHHIYAVAIIDVTGVE